MPRTQALPRADIPELVFCPGCGTDQPETAFPWTKTGGGNDCRSKYCEHCKRARDKLRQRKRAEKIKNRLKIDINKLWPFKPIAERKP